MNQPALNDKRRPQAAHDPYQVRIAVKRSPDRGTAVGRHRGAERGQVSRAFRHLGSRIDHGGACRIQDRRHAVPPLDTGAVNDPMPRCGTLARARWGLGPVGPVGRILPHKGPPAVRTRPARLALASPAIALHRPAATLRARLFSSSSTLLFNGVNPKGPNLLERKAFFYFSQHFLAFMPILSEAKNLRLRQDYRESG